MLSTDETKNIYNKVMTDTLEQDVVVLDGIHEVPLMGEEFHTHHFYLGLCLKGQWRGCYDYQEKTFRAGDIAWIKPDHVVKHMDISDDYEVLCLFLSKRYYRELQQNGILGQFMCMPDSHISHLDTQDFNTIYTGLSLMKMLIDRKTGSHLSQITELIHVLVGVVDEALNKIGFDSTQNYGPHEQLFSKFEQAIMLHYRESREVAYYANLMCLTPKYFATVIKELTGVTASDWINRYVIVEAKWLLQHQQNKSIQQIANYLGFTEQSSFSRFFKRYEGVTPNVFRKKG